MRAHANGRMQNGRAATEVTTPPVADAQALIPRADSAEDKQAMNRRAIAAFHTTLFLDDLVGAIRELRAVERVRRQREADGNPAEVESC